ncbi:tRNA (adenosine(37)-N6)-threonylcarbamoyltransferase complex dimerization subunit type 1 TsaB [Ponticoccus sp. (in: a-proteobacteria)]|uniref:tRNA (adenosine(37)-N6)-threonylcarbamoyltransferase complex dimerization subunit type 1 TsaB n=1 Tax=Ponticoccus sp. (in: a-proteobacteria) TaxID=1925025 RepID=UPI003AB53E07
MILAFDTSGPHCAAALLGGDHILAARVEAMKKGQAERLMPLLEELLAETGAAWADLTRIGVGIGPGNFTGIRLAVSAARGLALALKVPALGVSGFEIIRHGPVHGAGTVTGALLAVVPGPREQAYIEQPDGSIAFGPMVTDPARAACLGDDWQANIATLARIAAAKTPGPRPAPLYVKPADAAPASDPPPVILDADDA